MKENHIGFLVYKGDKHLYTVMKSIVKEFQYQTFLDQYKSNKSFTIFYLYESPSLVPDDDIIKVLREIVETLFNADNEITSAPYWLIIDPRQSFSCDVHDIASMITGPFFSRETAEGFLTNTRYNFGKRAKVYCHSGNYSYLYSQLCNALKIGFVKTKEDKKAVINKYPNISTNDEVK